MVLFNSQSLPGTKVIFVMGQSGTGKTTMLQELTGLDLKVGSTLSSGKPKNKVLAWKLI